VTANPNSEAGRAVFATTHWSVVLGAGQEDSPTVSEALTHLCRTYWYPLYAYVRRKGYPRPDAEDLTQEFFAQLLAKHFLSTADRRKGKFRSFLLGAFEHFLAREWRRTHAEKRGGGQAAFSLDEIDAERRYLMEPTVELPAERLFDRRWATTLLEAAMAELRKEYQSRDQAELFARLQGALSGDGEVDSYADIGDALQMNEGAVKVAVYRLRKRYGELIRAQIAQTVATPAQVDEELEYLFTILRE
jgi:DNA-directed RNA polymerase specialized sigma24 family protein